MARLDWIVLVAYLAGIVGIGVWSGRGNRRIDDFFLAGRQMKWWAIGLSVMATQISAITFIGTTGQAYTDAVARILGEERPMRFTTVEKKGFFSKMFGG